MYNLIVYFVSMTPMIAPLHLAVRAGHEEAVHVLLEQGADPHAKNNACHTPYQVSERTRKGM